MLTSSRIFGLSGIDVSNRTHGSPLMGSRRWVVWSLLVLLGLCGSRTSPEVSVPGVQSRARHRDQLLLIAVLRWGPLAGPLPSVRGPYRLHHTVGRCGF